MPIANDFVSVVKYVPDEGHDEYLVVAGRNYGQPHSRFKSNYTIYNDDHKAIGQLNLPWTVCNASAVDIDADGTKELLVSFLDDTLAGIRAYKWPALNVIWESHLLERNFRWRGVDHWDIILRAEGIVNSAASDQAKLLVSVREGFAGMPSGLMALNPHTGVQIWNRWIASGILDIPDLIHLIDTDEDRNAEIIGGTSACNNGAAYDGISDDRSYVYAVDHRGAFRWLHEVPLQFSVCMPFPCTAEGRPALIVLQAVNGSSCADSLVMLDATNGNVIKEVALAPATSPRRISRWNEKTDRTEQWMISSRGAKPLITDAQLHIEEPVHDILGVILPTDLDGDGKLEAL